MRHLIRAVAAGTVVLAMIGGATAADVIAERKQIMKSNGASMKAIKAAVEGGKAAEAAAPAEDIASSIKKFTALFPQGSGQGDTGAKPEIWADWSGFEKAAADTVAAADKLAMVAKSGDAAATGDAMKALGGTCGNCHKPFRKPQT